MQRPGEETGGADQAPHQQLAQMLRRKAVLSPQVHIHSLSSPTSSSLVTNHCTSSAASVKPHYLTVLPPRFPTAAPAHTHAHKNTRSDAHSTCLQPILIPVKKTEGEKETWRSGAMERDDCREKREGKEMCQWEARLQT